MKTELLSEKLPKNKRAMLEWTTHIPPQHTDRYRNNKDVYIHRLVYIYIYYRSVGAPVVPSTHSAQITTSKSHSPIKKRIKTPWEMVYSRAGAEKIQGESGTSCSAGK